MTIKYKIVDFVLDSNTGEHKFMRIPEPDEQENYFDTKEDAVKFIEKYMYEELKQDGYTYVIIEMYV